MVSKEKRQLYNKRYYAKKTLNKLKSLDTIDETNNEIINEPTYKDHFLMLLFIRVFDIFHFSFMKWFKQ